MTIKIEQDAIIRALNTARSTISCHPQFLLKPQPSLGGLLCPGDAEPPLLASYVAVVPKTSGDDDDDCCPDLLPLDPDEDCISLSSFSSASFCSGRSTERRVSFAASLVTDVRTRPRTKNCDKKLLYYTQSETDRFRQVYREERQSLSSLDSERPGTSDKEPPKSESSGRRRISRVVVEHNDSLETFYDINDFTSYSPPHNGGSSMNEAFFDNDSFWSGSITWY